MNYGKLEYALELYQKAYSLNPNRFDVVINIAHILREVTHRH